MESTYIFYIAFQVLKVLPIKICKIQPPDLLFLFVLFTFTSGGIFHKFLDFIRRYLKKIFSSRIFLFSGFAQTPPPHPPISPYPLKRPKSAKGSKCFLSMLPNTYLPQVNFGHLLEAASPTQFRVDVLSHRVTLPILFCLRFSPRWRW